MKLVNAEETGRVNMLELSDMSQNFVAFVQGIGSILKVLSQWQEHWVVRPKRSIGVVEKQ